MKSYLSMSISEVSMHVSFVKCYLIISWKLTYPFVYLKTACTCFLSESLFTYSFLSSLQVCFNENLYIPLFIWSQYAFLLCESRFSYTFQDSLQSCFRKKLISLIIWSQNMYFFINVDLFICLFEYSLQCYFHKKELTYFFGYMKPECIFFSWKSICSVVYLKTVYGVFFPDSEFHQLRFIFLNQCNLY